MNKGWLLMPAALWVVTASGCADKAAAEKTFAQTVQVINEMCDVLQQSPSVREARPKLEKSIHKLEAVRDEGNRVLVTQTQMAEIQNKFQPQFKKAALRLATEERALLRRDPRGRKDLKSVLDRFRSIMTKK